MESEAGAIRTSRAMAEYPAGMSQPVLEGSTLRSTLRQPKHALHSGLHGISESGGWHHIITSDTEGLDVAEAPRRQLPNGLQETRSLPEGSGWLCAAARQTTRNQPETVSQPKQAVVNRDLAMCRLEGCIGMPSIRQSM